MIRSLKRLYTVTSFSLVFFNDARLPQWLAERGYDPGSTTRLARRDGTYYEGLDLYEALAEARGDPIRNLEIIGNSLLIDLVLVGDAAKGAGLYDGTPEMEFMRHVRNAAAHGNSFHFAHNEPRRPAHFKGFVIDHALQGRKLLFEYMSTGDVFDLFDYVEGRAAEAGPEGERPTFDE